MNLAPSRFQRQLAESARAWLEHELPITRSRTLAESGALLPDEQLWRASAGLGWLGLALPDELGGLGLGAAEEVMLFRELGRGLAPGPYLSTVLGAHAAAINEPALSAEISSGARRVATAIGARVLDGAAGDLMIAIDDRGAVLSEIVECEPLESLDSLVRLARVVHAVPILEDADPMLLARAHTLAAAELLGVIEAVRDISAEYAKTRTQFGRPIGTFQAVKHRCADMAVAAYSAVGQVHLAALYVDDRRASAPFHAAAAYLVAARGAARSAADTIQNLGGIGFTWEHDVHLYLKRATVLANLFGPLRDAHSRLMASDRHDFE